MPEECPNCGSDDLEFIQGYPSTLTEPGASDGWECCNCGAWIDDEMDEATRMGI